MSTKRPTIRPLVVYLAFLAVTIPLWCNAFLAPPDSGSYFAIPMTILRDGDLDFSKSYETLRFRTYLVYLTPTQRMSMDWPIGSGLVWLPAYAIGHLLALVLPGELFDPNGVSGIHKLAVLTWVMTLGSAGLWLGLTMARPYFGEWNSLAALFCVLLGTPVGFYFYMYGLMSHTTSMAMVGVLLWGWHRTRQDLTGKPRSARAWLLLGMAAGVATLIRPQNAAFLIVFVIEFISLARGGRLVLRDWIRGPLLATAAAIFTFLPQMILWWCLYGNPLQLPKIEEMHWFEPQLVLTLFSDYHGILPWSPVLVLLIPGAWFLWRRDAVLSAALCLAIVIQVYLNAANEIWWAGGSFGNRRMVNCGIPFVVLIAAALHGMRPLVAAIVAVPLAGWNLLLIAAERAGRLSLAHYVPWDTWDFLNAVLPMALPWRFFPGMLGDFAGFGWTARLLFMAVGLSIAIGVALHHARLLRALPRVSNVLCMITVMYFAAMPFAFVVMARRTPVVTHADMLAKLPRENRSLFNGFYEVGYYYLLRGRIDESIRAYEKAAELRPEFANTYRYLAGIQLEELDNPERALHYSGIALDLDPFYRAAYDTELAAISRILESQPGRVDLVLRLLDRLERAGRGEEAQALREANAELLPPN